MQTTKRELSYLLPRRQTLMAIAGFASLPFYARGAFAEELTRTARVEEGPFYPRKLPLDTDNDLLIINDSITPAVGEVTAISGRLLDSGGSPIRNALIEIWQVDNTATYLEEENRSARTGFDGNFQGFGRFLTGSTGDYLFRTIKPVPYHGRPAPHVHFKVKIKGREPWTTQLFVKGHPGNAQDQIYRRVGDAKALATVTAEFLPVKDSPIGELQARFDIVIGTTARG
jgi:protocatechuate 3,4-dioxygenase beta subunit